MSREWNRAARERRKSTRSLGSRWRARAELTATISALSRVVDAVRLSATELGSASGAATKAQRTTAHTDSAPRRIRSAIIYQINRTTSARNVKKVGHRALCARK